MEIKIFFEMTPKEKAKEIYCKYADALNIRDLQTTANPFVKQCALIAVDEILSVLPQSEYLEDRGEFNENRERIYWQEVKQEIEKL